MQKKRLISFPYLNNYNTPLIYLFKKLTKDNVTYFNKDENSKDYSPDFVCTKFKYNLKSYIQALDNGADIIIEVNNCKYIEHYEVEKQILKDLGYHFEFFSLTNNFFNNYKIFKKINKHLCIIKYSYYLLITILMINFINIIDNFIRSNIGFEKENNSFCNLKAKMLSSFRKCTNPFTLYYMYKKYFKKFQNLPINKPNNYLKVAIIGTLHEEMEPFSTYYLEQELAKENIIVKRFININKKIQRKIKNIKKNCNYVINSNEMNNVYKIIYLNNENYDGLIYIKPFGCIREISTLPLSKKIANNLQIPITYFNFKENISIEEIQTQLKEFITLVKEKRSKSIYLD